MTYGPVPSKIYDIVKYVGLGKEEGLTSACFTVDGYVVTQTRSCDRRYLSESHVECLDKAVAMCKDLSFDELTRFSHQSAWQQAKQNEYISYRDMVLECGNTEEYAEYVEEQILAANILAS